MASSSLLALSLLLLAALVQAQINPSIVGTWSTKSGKVLTGPGFYDPVHERFFEPALTGVSYSFTADGHYEEAYYRSVANPVTPACPSAIIQWQHGTFTETANGSLVLHPFAGDGRQLLSEPCNYHVSILTRYNQSELILKWSVYTDPYKNQLRLDMEQWDGTPYNPMWLVYSPPQMLPTQTLNPTASSTKTASLASSTATQVKFAKRHVGEAAEHMTFPIHEKLLKKNLKDPMDLHSGLWFWFGLGFTGLGGLMFAFS